MCIRDRCSTTGITTKKEERRRRPSFPFYTKLNKTNVLFSFVSARNQLEAASRGKRRSAAAEVPLDVDVYKRQVYTYLNVGEGVFDLYGFATQSELHTFRMLLGVSGVGPKAALAILSTGTPDALAMAIITGDEKTLTAAPGIGKKIAQRIILELKDKLAKESAATGLDFSNNGTSVNAVSFTNKASEAAQALAVLGYSSAEVAVALKLSLIHI